MGERHRQLGARRDGHRSSTAPAQRQEPAAAWFLSRCLGLSLFLSSPGVDRSALPEPPGQRQHRRLAAVTTTTAPFTNDLYSGPSPVASLASTLLGLEVNASRGDELRAMLYSKTRRVLDHLEKLGAATLNTSSFPIIEVPLAEVDQLDRVGALLFERGIYTTLAFYPGVPRHEVGFRVQLTVTNTGDQIDELLVVLDELADRGRLRTGALS